jgi:hypothetical protein
MIEIPPAWEDALAISERIAGRGRDLRDTGSAGEEILQLLIALRDKLAAAHYGQYGQDEHYWRLTRDGESIHLAVIFPGGSESFCLDMNNRRSTSELH